LASKSRSDPKRSLLFSEREDRLGALAPWADNAEIKTAFPTVQAALVSPLSDKTTFILGDSVWIVAKTPQDTQASSQH